ncbi:thiol reductase thioredoxin [Streptococcus suis]|uniref:thiol reductase thioredoxin n=1 Tax=Streptococcus suis TaxID=1307 RepID=UPI000402EC65|nr:thiol reductase thioredoxin [Streptococcus suis 10581]
MKKNLFKTLLLSTAIFAMIGTNTVLAEENEENSQTSNSSVAVVESTVPSSEENVEVTAKEVVSVGDADDSTAVAEPANSEVTEEEPAEITSEEYAANVADFQKISIEDVRQTFTEDGLEHTIYFGRETCYYCRQFSPELKELNQLIDNKLEYYDTDGADFDDSAKEFLFQTVGIPGTPTVIYVKNGQPVSGWVGGGVTAKQLYYHLYLGQSSSQQPEGTQGADNSEEQAVQPDVEEKVEEKLESEKVIVESEKQPEPTVTTVSNSTLTDISANLTVAELEKQNETITVATAQTKNSEVVVQASPNPVQMVATEKVEQTKLYIIPDTSRSTDTVKTAKTLPNTGDTVSLTLFRLGVVLLMFSLGVVFKVLKTHQEK